MGWIFLSISFQYLITMGVALIIFFFIYKKQPSSPTKNALLMLSLFIAAWQVAAFLHRSAPSALISKTFIIIDDAFYMAICPFMFLVLLNAYKYRRLNLLATLLWPAQFLSTLLFSDVRVELSEMYGWTYAFSFKASLPVLFLMGVTYAAPIFGVVVIALKTLSSFKDLSISATLKRKFTYLMIALIISQAFGVPLTNLLLFSQPEMPPFGGVIELISLFFLWQALHTRVGALEVPMVKVSKGDLASAYTYFLRKLQEKVIPKVEIGEHSVHFYRLVEFLGLKDAVEYKGARITISKEEFRRSDPISLLDRLLSFMEADELVKQYADYALGLINITGMLSSSSKESLEMFNNVIKMHFDLLEETDLIAGISYGRLAHLLYTKEREDGWLTLIRIYKRALLSSIGSMEEEALRRVIKDVSFKAKEVGVEIGLFGDVSLLDFEHRVARLKDKEDYVLDTLSGLIAEVYASALSVSDEEGKGFIKRLKVALTGETPWFKKVNEAIAIKLLSRFPYGLIAPLFRVREEVPFSSELSVKHEDLIGKAILIEFDPRRRYEKLVSGFVKECIAHGEGCVVFTRLGSRVHREVSPIGARVVKLAYVRPSGGEYALMTDRIKTLDMMNRVFEPLTSIVFDNLTDMILSMGEKEAYTFVIQALEILNKGLAPSLFLINERAHEERTVKAFEALFPTVVSFVGERAKLLS